MRTSPAACIVSLSVFLAVGISAATTVFAEPPADAKPKEPSSLDRSYGIAGQDRAPAETRIEKALEEPTEVEFIDAPLSDVVDFLKTRHKIDIRLHKKALDEAGIATDSAITQNLKNVSLRSALRILLRDLGLNYVIRDETLSITTNAEAETIMQIRVYPVGDLLDRTDRDELRLNPASDLIETITSSAAPTSWSEVGGAGGIRYLPVVESLVIRQTSDVHDEIHDLLGAARKARSLEPAGPERQAADVDPNQLFVQVYRLDGGTEVYELAADAAPAGNKDAKPTEKKPATPTKALLVSNRALADDLARAIPKIVEPASWQDGGGQGTIESIGVGLAVRQTRRVHLEVARFLQSVERSKMLSVPMHSGGGGMFRVGD
jgi:hypothetical protein